MKNSKNCKTRVRQKSQSQRQLRASDLIRSVLMECFRKSARLHPDLFGCPVSITKVTISADLKIANIFFLPFNTDMSIERILTALEASQYAIRDYVNREINMKYSPEIRFFYDAEFEKWDFIDNYQLYNKN